MSEELNLFSKGMINSFIIKVHEAKEVVFIIANKSRKEDKK